MRLFILRHGQAEAFAASDAERELVAAGRSELQRVVRASANELSAVSKLWVSPLRRAQQTADVVTDLLGPIPRETSDLLLPESSVSHALEMLEGLEASSYLLVSHQPLVGELVNALCGKAQGYYPMGTAALANIELEHPAVGCGNLVWLR